MKVKAYLHVPRSSERTKFMVLLFHYIIVKLAIYKYYFIVTCSANLILPLTEVKGSKITSTTLLVLLRGKTELKICSLIKLSY